MERVTPIPNPCKTAQMTNGRWMLTKVADKVLTTLSGEMDWVGCT